jgi:D-alanyl-lipoteichoic acid acyltransferase DltB (MBOAT superfamily)
MGIGFFLKVFVADTISYVVDMAYNNLSTSSGILILIAAFLYFINYLMKIINIFRKAV